VDEYLEEKPKFHSVGCEDRSLVFKVVFKGIVMFDTSPSKPVVSCKINCTNRLKKMKYYPERFHFEIVSHCQKERGLPQLETEEIKLVSTSCCHVEQLGTFLLHFSRSALPKSQEPKALRLQKKKRLQPNARN
jgi:hypothetical protein